MTYTTNMSKDCWQDLEFYYHYTSLTELQDRIKAESEIDVKIKLIDLQDVVDVPDEIDFAFKADGSIYVCNLFKQRVNFLVCDKNDKYAMRKYAMRLEQ